MLKTFKINISGQVQGVGFRPFVYNLAQQYHIKGTVSNDELGVIIIITQKAEICNKFYETLIKNPPPVSKIVSSQIIQSDLWLFDEFKIIPSAKNSSINLPLTPDFAICTICKQEIKNKKNRRYQYPFTTCVNCGPRWAITQEFPFDRANTSIETFKMCGSCQSEYQNPENRRFHSQTNTCKKCGIDYYLTDNFDHIIDNHPKTIFKSLAKLLKAGKIVAIKNTSGYLLCCNAENKEVIKRLRLLKKRPNKPFAILYPNEELLNQQIEIRNNELEQLKLKEAPIVIISHNNFKGKIALKQVAPKLNQLGVMLPYTGILELLAQEINFPIVATSGNIHGSPIISSRSKAKEKLAKIADAFFHHNLKILHPQDDSVMKFSSKHQLPVIFRRSRGYAPNYFINLRPINDKIMALGADLKSTITFLPNQYVYVSQYLGNLENFEVYQRFENTIYNFESIFNQKPTVVLTDAHPSYVSTQFGRIYAEKLQIKKIKIQHHRAHFAAILGEHQLFDRKILGVIFDGTGYGDDAAIWGGEFFEYHNHKINRIHHLNYFNWLLGDKMSKEPRLSLFSLVNFKNEVVQSKFSKEELNNYQYLKKNNKLKTSSVGRLFDAVASLLQLTDFNSYEGEAAIYLENLITNYQISECYSYLDSDEFNGEVIINKIIFDLEKEIPKEKIAINFLYSLAKYCIDFSQINNYNEIAFSGGVFQNTILIDLLISLAPSNIKLYFHKDLSPNDENLSFGQLMYYLNIKEN
ncbi:MAG: carbamoyltransferase HypF [Lutibacter sp.]